MKNRIARILLAASLATATAVQAAVYLTPNVPSKEVALAWDPSPDESVTGYNIYFGAGPRAYTNKVPVGNVLSCTISNLTPGVRYFFSATAHDLGGRESEFCNEVFWLVPKPLAPIPSLRATNATITVTLEKAPRMKGPWSEFARGTTETAFPGFYRASVAISYPERTMPESGAIDYRRRKATVPPIPGQS